MKILVVDYSETMRRIVRDTLKLNGHTDIVEAKDSLSALAVLDDSIEFIIADYEIDTWVLYPELPESLGIFEKVKNQDKYIPLLVITYRDNHEEAVSKFGREACLMKPFTMTKLKEVMEVLLNKGA